MPGSDADILVLLKEYDKPFMERIQEYLKAFEIDFPVEVGDTNQLVQEALKRGILLFERQ